MKERNFLLVARKSFLASFFTLWNLVEFSVVSALHAQQMCTPRSLLVLVARFFFNIKELSREFEFVFSMKSSWSKSASFYVNWEERTEFKSNCVSSHFAVDCFRVIYELSRSFEKKDRIGFTYFSARKNGRKIASLLRILLLLLKNVICKRVLKISNRYIN